MRWISPNQWDMQESSSATIQQWSSSFAPLLKRRWVSAPKWCAVNLAEWLTLCRKTLDTKTEKTPLATNWKRHKFHWYSFKEWHHGYKLGTKTCSCSSISSSFGLLSDQSIMSFYDFGWIVPHSEICKCCGNSPDAWAFCHSSRGTLTSHNLGTADIGRFAKTKKSKPPLKHIQANNYNSSWAVISSQELGF